jgi:hypothetical protein
LMGKRVDFSRRTIIIWYSEKYHDESHIHGTRLVIICVAATTCSHRIVSYPFRYCIFPRTWPGSLISRKTTLVRSLGEFVPPQGNTTGIFLQCYRWS